MKTTELMLGDYVRFSPTSPDYKKFGDKPFRVSTINSDGALALTMDNSSYWVDAEDIEPIPITKELLLNNNFRVSYFGCYVYESEDDSFDLDNHVSVFPGNWVCGINPNKTQRIISYAEITYLHELQHLLNMCNIKIDWKL